MKASIKNLVYFLGLFLLSLVLFSCYDPNYPPLGKKMSKELTASYNNIADELGIPNLPQGTKWMLDAYTKPYDKRAPWDIRVCSEYIRKDNPYTLIYLSVHRFSVLHNQSAPKNYAKPYTNRTCQ